MKASEFACEWVENNWRPHYRYALVTGEPTKERCRVNPDLPAEEYIEAFGKYCDIQNKVLDGLAESQMNAEEALRLIKSAGYSQVLFLAESKQQLIEILTQLCREGVNAWTEAGSDKLEVNGVLYANFWHEDGHGLFDDAKLS
jgi:hypothetical protein